MPGNITATPKRMADFVFWTSAVEVGTLLDDVAPLVDSPECEQGSCEHGPGIELVAAEPVAGSVLFGYCPDSSFAGGSSR